MSAKHTSRWAYWVIAVLLLPFAVAITRTVLALVDGFGSDPRWGLPPAAWAMSGGGLLWLFFFATMPRPMRTYVIGHELTHALWAWLSGARVSNLNVRSGGGSVVVSRTNMMITLAPYFFPFYTILCMIAYGMLSIWFDLRPYYLAWLAAIGFTWSFHLTFTIASLLHHQSDIDDYGWFFSYVVIYLFNMAGIAIWLVIVGQPTFREAFMIFAGHTWSVWRWCGVIAWHMSQFAYNKIKG